MFHLDAHWFTRTVLVATTSSICLLVCGYCASRCLHCVLWIVILAYYVVSSNVDFMISNSLCLIKSCVPLILVVVNFWCWYALCAWAKYFPEWNPWFFLVISSMKNRTSMQWTTCCCLSTLLSSPNMLVSVSRVCFLVFEKTLFCYQYIKNLDFAIDLSF